MYYLKVGFFPFEAFTQLTLSYIHRRIRLEYDAINIHDVPKITYR